MSSELLYAMSAILAVLAVGGAYLAFAGGDAAQKRVGAIAKQQPLGRGGVRGQGGPDNAAAKRKNVNTLLKEIEKQQKENKKRPTLRKRIMQAGFSFTPQQYWIGSAGFGIAVGIACFLSGQSLLVTLMATFGLGVGFPRWVLNFMKNRD